MSKIDKNLSDIFDVTPIGETIENPIVPIETEVVDSRIDQDYENTRNNLYILLQQGKSALEHALEVAKSSEHPRAFEVVGGLMKQISDINLQLMDLHSKKANLENKTKKEENPSTPSNITNNAIFVGSTTELSKMIENMRKGA